MYSDTGMYLGSRNPRAPDAGSRYWGRADGTLDRVLLVLGAISLLLLVPILWIWLVYGGRDSGVVYGGGAALCAITVGIGMAMIRVLDGRR